MSARIRRISTSHRPVFLVNSRLGLFSAAHSWALLLPKLRSHFAEFLNKGSPARLRILSSPTCVGLRYGRLRYTRSFSRQREFSSLPIVIVPHHSPAFRCAYFTTQQPHCLDVVYHRHALPILLCHCIRLLGGIGILTDCPSPTTIVLGLGPDLP